MKRRHVFVVHGLGAKFLPSIFLFAIFAYVSPWTDDWIPIDPESFWTGLTIFWAGAVFVFEGIYAIPQNRTASASWVAAVFMMFVGVISLIISFLIWFTEYSVLRLPEVDRWWVTMILLFDLVLLILSGLWEVIAGHHMVAKKTPVHAIATSS